MVGGFAAVLSAGHLAASLLVVALQAAMIRELFQLARLKSGSFPVNPADGEGKAAGAGGGGKVVADAMALEETSLPGFRLQLWGVCFSASFYIYGHLLKNHLVEELEFRPDTFDTTVLFLLQHHDLISFALYVAGLVGFVLRLKKGWMMYQFSQYGWTCMIVGFIVTQTSFFVASIFRGFIWFILPVSLVISNDVMAYLTGFALGRTPLLKISPKKTWEGFIGGGLLTLVLSVPLARLLSRYRWMTCPRKVSPPPVPAEPAGRFLRNSPRRFGGDQPFPSGARRRTDPAAARFRTSPLAPSLRPGPRPSTAAGWRATWPTRSCPRTACWATCSPGPSRSGSPRSGRPSRGRRRRWRATRWCWQRSRRSSRPSAGSSPRGSSAPCGSR